MPLDRVWVGGSQSNMNKIDNDITARLPWLPSLDKI